MKQLTVVKLLVSGLVIAILLASPTLAPAQEAAATDGKETFMAHRCNTCHAIASADIAAKSDKTAGPDLGGYEVTDFDALAQYLRKEIELDGEKHTKTFKGTDEELQLILDWLATLEPMAEADA